jgi:hypothetical protein
LLSYSPNISADVPLSSVFYPIHPEEQVLTEFIEVVFTKKTQIMWYRPQLLLNHMGTWMLRIVVENPILNLIW